MAVITILPSGLKIETKPGSTLLKAVSSEGTVCWPQTCGGKAQCATCVYRVVEGSENLSPVNRLEQYQLVSRRGRQALNQNLRLACQTVVHGDVTVHKNVMIL